jgi:CRP-like cAMP-binding protein
MNSTTWILLFIKFKLYIIFSLKLTLGVALANPLPFSQTRHYPPQTILLREGALASELCLIKKGCIRSWFNKEGVDITLQFFFEGDSVTALDSFLHQVPSDIFLESIEETLVEVVDRETFLNAVKQDAEIKDWFYGEAIRKLLAHTHRLLSLLQYKPLERYQQLLSEDERIIKRVPQLYIASYLGITPVSLSRIRKRVSK